MDSLESYRAIVAMENSIRRCINAGLSGDAVLKECTAAIESAERRRLVTKQRTRGPAVEPLFADNVDPDRLVARIRSLIEAGDLKQANALLMPHAKTLGPMYGTLAGELAAANNAKGKK